LEGHIREVEVPGVGDYDGGIEGAEGAFFA